MAELERIRFNLASPVRHERMEDRDYLVAPMVMITEGVHNGSGGPIYYPADEISKAVSLWDHKPIVVYHPERNGVGVTACDPVVLTNRKVGIILNTKWDDKLNKLRAEAWMEKSRLKTVDDRVLTALEENKLTEVSTGLFLDPEKKEGKWVGPTGVEEEYNAIGRNHKPDHLAILPDKLGACSIADGAGLLQLNAEIKKADEEKDPDRKAAVERLASYVTNLMGKAGIISNEMSFDNIRHLLQKALASKVGKPGEYWHGWIEDVYKDFCVYWDDGKLYRIGYSSTDGGVTLSGDPVEVKRVIEYVALNEGVTDNSAPESVKLDNGDKEMDKKEMVNALIKNTKNKWEESDRAYLEGLDDKILVKMGAADPPTPDPKPGEPGDEPEPQPAPDPKPKPTPKKADEEKATDNVLKPAEEVKATKTDDMLSPEEYLQKTPMPPAIKRMLENGLATHNAQRQRVIKRITDNKKNRFSAEYLTARSDDELAGIAALLGEEEQQTPQTNGIFGDYGPSAGNPPTHNATKVEPLLAPAMKF